MLSSSKLGSSSQEDSMTMIRERELLSRLSNALETGRHVESARRALRKFYSEIGMY